MQDVLVSGSIFVCLHRIVTAKAIWEFSVILVYHFFSTYNSIRSQQAVVLFDQVSGWQQFCDNSAFVRDTFVKAASY